MSARSERTEHTPRRTFLKGAAFGAAGLGAAAAAGCERSGAAPSPAVRPVERTQAFASYVALDLQTDTTAQTDDLLRTLAARVRQLQTEHVPASVGISAPPSDSGTLGPVVAPDGLVINMGYGATFFDHAHGDRKPKGIKAMREFEDDALDRSKCHGDMLLEIRADQQDVVVHALRELTRATRGGLTVRWRQEGSSPPPRPDGAPRNHFGFKDGTSNPTGADFDSLVWIDEPTQPWTRGGTFLVVRLIRMLTEFWDRVSISEQENMFGRVRTTGAPLDGDHESDAPRFEDDPSGDIIPLTAHMRLANPRTSDTDRSRIFRRAYNYTGGADANGNLDLGLVFTCLQRDIEAQFEATQERLEGEPLTDYISPIGGGYFYLPPRDAGSGISTTGGIL
ncbi:Dyp-type peroxidase [Tsukamurella sp. 8F]|uniref:Dyp-type peroxidase n=1 Tax=unclassified Tsukamurella TaxID=2633480 RepID=UPI0023B90E7D|nr:MULTISPECIES: Dyp-type peroxidase [unclassified Tsukamurella]MDF0532487.1 Dyp-type peroxidase [Tsukamurella sp. 8J]MDF0589158.1 Dyp-type peroxidase [Tsukamurella sp. 8F]